MFRILTLASAAALMLGACTTIESAPDADSLGQGELHFPTRKVNNLDDANLRTIRGDLIESGNCLYLTNVTGQPSSRRYVVTWPSNTRIERRQVSGSRTNLEVVSVGAEFNDNTRSVAEVPSRVEVLGMLKNEPFVHSGRFKTQRNSGCVANQYAPVRTWRRVGASRT